MNSKNLWVIVGPTASGKTALAIKLAKKYKGEIISADSRQIYRGMDIGTGKDIQNSEFRIKNSELKGKIQNKINLKIQLGVYEVDKIPIWGLDLIKPNQEFSVSQWVEFSKMIIKDIWKRDRLPVVVGGTGFWIKGLLTGIEWGGVKPNLEFRIKNSELNIDKLQKQLKKYPKKYTQGISLSDWQNKRRLIRRIEIAEFVKKHPKANVSIKGLDKDIKPKIICLKPDKKTLKKRIEARVKKRLKQGLIREIEELLLLGYSFNDPGLNTLGYKEFSEYFASRTKDKDLLAQAVEQWKHNEWQYGKRQMGWIKKYL